MLKTAMSRSTARQKPVLVDGTMLEGGGQILRLALGLSSLTNRAIQIQNIRGKRGTKDRERGIKQAHLGGAAWLTQAAEASTDGLALRSRDLVFEPGLGTAAELKEVHKSVEKDGVTIGKPVQMPQPGSKAAAPPIWTEVHENGQLLRRETFIGLTTPGSAFGVLQAMLPFLLFHPSLATYAVPHHVTIEGGTNVWHAMSAEWAEHVLFPILHTKLGIGPLRLTLHQRSWSTGARSTGCITVELPPRAPADAAAIPLPAFSLTDRGPLSRFALFVFAPTPAWRRCVTDHAEAALADRWPDIPVTTTSEPSGHPVRLYVLLVAHTEHGYRLGRDYLHADKLPTAPKDRIAEIAVHRVTEAMRAELAHDGCVDEYLQDQLVVFQALARGRSVVHRPVEPSLHTRTARWVAELVCGVNFDADGNCEGIAFGGPET